MTLTQNDLQAIGSLIDEKLDKKLKNTETKIIKQMKKETKQIVKFFDEEYLGHDKRIKRIEKQFNLPPLAD